MDNSNISQFEAWLREAGRVVIVSHTNPDGDAVGSLLGTKHAIGGMLGKEAAAMLPNACPDYFGFLPGSEKIISADQDMGECERLLAEADLIVGVDFNNATRIDALGEPLKKASAKKVLIDHHHNPDTELFDIVFSVNELSSACELVYWTFRQMWGADCFGKEMATCLYTGICTDTGSFSYSCDQPSLYEAAAALVEYDIDPADIHNHIVNNFSINRMKLFGFAISERLRIFEEKRMAYFYISLEDQRRLGVAPSDLEGLVNYTLQMQQIEVGALIREEKERCKISLRSKYGFDVNVFAKEHFGGGGHVKAAGATCLMPFEETIKKLETELLAEL